VNGLGVDAISLKLRVAHAVEALRRDRQRQVPVGGAAAFFELRGEHVRLEVKPPAKVLDPTDLGPLPVERLSEMLDRVLRATRLLDLVEPVGPFERSYVTRVDGTRDFHGVPDQLAVLVFEALSHVPRRIGGRARGIHARDGRLEGVQVGGGPQHSKLYRKSEQLWTRGFPAPPGIVRFEVEAHADWLRRADIVTLDDVTPDAVEALARRRWDASLFGSEVVGWERLNDLTRAIDWGRVVSRSQWLGDAVRLALGEDLGGSSDRRQAFYRHQRELGVPAVVAPWAPVGGRFSARLDFETGELVVGADSKDVERVAGTSTGELGHPHRSLPPRPAPPPLDDEQLSALLDDVRPT
jgi:hypothetical protein